MSSKVWFTNQLLIAAMARLADSQQVPVEIKPEPIELQDPGPPVYMPYLPSIREPRTRDWEQREKPRKRRRR